MKNFMLLFPACLLSFGLMAQSPITIGPKISLSFNKLSDTENQSFLDYDYSRSWSGGVFIRGSIGKFYLQPEAYFNTKGGDFQINNDPQNSSIKNVYGKVRLTSLDVPVLFGFKIVEGETTRSNFRIFSGPFASFILNEKENDLKLLQPENYEFNKYNIGLQAGLGIDVGHLTLDARYETGLNQINSNFNQRANSIQLSLGLKVL